MPTEQTLNTPNSDRLTVLRTKIRTRLGSGRHSRPEMMARVMRTQG